MSTIQLQPLIPLALWLSLVVGGAVTLAWYAALRPAVMSRLRWAIVMTLVGFALALTLLVLLNPTIVSPLPPPDGKPLVTILADRSASMALADQPLGNSRFQTAAELCSRLQKDLSKAFDIELRTFADKTRSASASELAALNPNGQVTDLATAIAESLDGSREQGQALVVLSDGIHNASGGSARVMQVAETARAMAVPVFASVIGGPTVIDDLDVSLVRQQELAFVGQKTPVRASIRQRGRLTAEAELQLLDEGGQMIERKQVQVPINGTGQAVFYITQPTVGLHRYQIRVEPLPREATTGNNASTFLLRTVNQPIRILLLEGKPYWDAKFLMRTLAQDSALEVDAFVRLADERYLKRCWRLTSAANEDSSKARRDETTEILRGQPLPLGGSEELSPYQIVVLGRDAESLLNDSLVEQLRTWIARDGGSLVCFRGQPVARLNQQLARLMPVRWSPSSESRFRMQLTRRGEELSWLTAAVPTDGGTLASLPSLATSARPQQPTPLAVVAAEAPDQGQPVVAYQPYGCGRVVAIEGAGMWRWAFLSPEHQQVEPVYETLWQGLMRWLVSGGGLAPGQDVALRTENVSFFTADSAFATLLVREATVKGELPRIELKREGAALGSFAPTAISEEPGVYRVSFGRLPEGIYLANIVGGDPSHSGTTIAFDVRPNFTEQLDTAARPDLLAQIAEKSGGAVLSDMSAGEIDRRFRAHLAHIRPLQVREMTIWDRWWVLTLIAGLWAVAWGLRRQRGLI